MKQMIIALIEKIYERVFKAKMTPEVYQFMKNLSWVFVGMAIAKSLLFIAHVLGGRAMGESLYGEFNLVMAIASFMMLFFFLGTNASIIQMIPASDSIIRKRKILSTYTVFSVLSIPILIIILVAFSSHISSLLRVGHKIFLGAIFMALCYSIYSYSESVLQAFHKMKQIGIAYIVSHGFMFILFIILYFKINSIYLLLAPISIYYLTFIFFVIPALRNRLTFSFDKKILKSILHFGFFLIIISTISMLLANVDKLMINYFVDASSVGLYQAYYNVSISAVGVLVGIFVKVFFPTASKFKEKSTILKRLNKTFGISAIIILLLLPFAIILLIKYGYSFQIKISLALMFTLATIFDVGAVLFATLLNSIGINAVKKSAIGMTLAFFVNIPLNLLLIPLIGVNGAVLATIFSTGSLFAYIYYSTHKIINKE